MAQSIAVAAAILILAVLPAIAQSSREASSGDDFLVKWMKSGGWRQQSLDAVVSLLVRLQADASKHAAQLTEVQDYLNERYFAAGDGYLGVTDHYLAVLRDNLPAEERRRAAATLVRRASSESFSLPQIRQMVRMLAALDTGWPFGGTSKEDVLATWVVRQPKSNSFSKEDLQWADDVLAKPAAMRLDPIGCIAMSRIATTAGRNDEAVVWVYRACFGAAALGTKDKDTLSLLSDAAEKVGKADHLVPPADAGAAAKQATSSKHRPPQMAEHGLGAEEAVRKADYPTAANLYSLYAEGCDNQTDFDQRLGVGIEFMNRSEDVAYGFLEQLASPGRSVTARKAALARLAKLDYDAGKCSECLQRLGELDKLTSLQATEEIHDFERGSLRATALIRLDRLDEAKSLLEAMEGWQGSNEEHAKASFLVGWMYLNANDAVKATDAFAKTAEKYPQTENGRKAAQLAEKLSKQ